MSLAQAAAAGESAQLRQLDPARLPRHVAVIMDGSGRWAAQRRRPRVAGHLAGVAAVRATVETCARLHIPALTLYAFSAENWRRPQAEVNFLMRLLRRFLRSEAASLKQQNIRLSAIGRLGELPSAVRTDLDQALAVTQACTGMVLTLGLNYGARAEVVFACQALVNEARARGTLESLHICEADVAARLYTAGLPEPDLLIRTSGEMRVSNFLLWQIAYAEIWVTPVLWPDFGERELLRALLDFQARERRFGGLSAASAAPNSAPAAKPPRPRRGAVSA
ncbi:MAG: isoprenyl transferase [Terriglobales bacterium]